MSELIDARGLQCPLPVIETKKVLKEMKEGSVEILVDNEIAVQNLTKMAKQMQLKSSSETIATDEYKVTIETTNQPATPLNNAVTPAIQGEKVTFNSEQCNLDLRETSTVVVLSSDHMGEGNDQLGKTLMKGFIYALTELEHLPQKIVLYNGGAKLSVEGADSLGDLKLLEAQGVEILTCGTCLNFYEISDKLAVGSVTNMYAIAEILTNASKIIKP
ncbi:MAG: sulfurtransferase-like selenium metabolism protein YedF [Lachnospiraceae bacterium]